MFPKTLIIILSLCLLSCVPEIELSGLWYSPYYFEIYEKDTIYRAGSHLIFMEDQKVEFINSDTFNIEYNGDRIKILKSDSIISTGRRIRSDQLQLKIGDSYNIYFPLKESNMPSEYMLADSLRDRIWKITINDSTYFELITNSNLQDYPAQLKRKNLRTGFVISGMTSYMNHYFYSIYDLDGVEGNKVFHIYDKVEEGYKIDFYDVERYYNTGYHQSFMKEIDKLNPIEKELVERKLYGTWYRSPYPVQHLKWDNEQDVKNSYWQLTLSKGQYIYKRGGIFDKDTINIESEGKWKLGANGKYLELYDDTFKIDELPRLEGEYDFFQFLTIETLFSDSIKVNMNIESLEKGYLDDGEYKNTWNANIPFVIYRK